MRYYSPKNDKNFYQFQMIKICENDYSVLTLVLLPAMYGRCTMSENNGCYRDATIHGFIQPTMSARLRSFERFSFRFGKMEFRAKKPSGDWLWPGRSLLDLTSGFNVCGEK